MINPLQKVKNTFQFHYYRRKNNWEFPENMAHTSGARVADGTYEPDLTNQVIDKIHEDALVLDVGANVGYYSRLFAEAVKERGKVIAFEAERENYCCLCKNTAGYRQVVPVAMAVSDKNAISELHLSSHSSCHSILNTGNYQSRSVVKAPSVKLDSFWELYLDKAPVDCVKIDVEGAEILVLDGMFEMLKQEAVKLIIVEFCPQIMINSGLEPIQLYDRIFAGFSIKIIESEYRNMVESGTIRNAEQFTELQNYLLDSSSFVNCNLLCERV